MTITASFIYSATVRDSFKNAIALNIGGTTPDTLKCALFSNTLAPVPDTDPSTYGVTPYDANEVTGTGWSAGGVALSSPTMTLVTSVGVMFDAADVSQASTTLTGARCAIIYDNTLSPKCNLVLVNFGQDYGTNAGTFAITWDANGIFRIDLTP